MVQILPADAGACKRGALEEGTATHSRVLAWRIPWPEEPGGLPSIGLKHERGKRQRNKRLVIVMQLTHTTGQTHK